MSNEQQPTPSTISSLFNIFTNIERHITNEIKQYNLGFSQYLLLVTLSDYEKHQLTLTQKQIGLSAHLDVSTTSKLLMELEKKGYVKREALLGKNKKVILTKDGAELARKLEQIHESTEMLFIKNHLSPKKVEQLNSILEKISR